MAVTTSIIGETLLVVMDRPPVNALDLDTIVELEDVFADAGQKAPRNGVGFQAVKRQIRGELAERAGHFAGDGAGSISRRVCLVVRAAAPMETSAQPVRREIKS